MFFRDLETVSTEKAQTIAGRRAVCDFLSRFCSGGFGHGAGMNTSEKLVLRFSKQPLVAIEMSIYSPRGTKETDMFHTRERQPLIRHGYQPVL